MENKIFPMQIRFSDIDAMGIVHNAVFFQYFEQARMLFFQELVGLKWDWSTHGVIVAHNEADYLAPVFLQEEIFVEIFCISVGTTSFCLGYKLIAKKGNETHLKAKGQSVMVCYNHETKAKTPIFEGWSELLHVHKGNY